MVTARTGGEALAAIGRDHPHLILLDIGLPDMGGFEVVRALQSDEKTLAIPIIGMTARHLDDSTVKMIRLEKNVRNFLQKPFSPKELREEIKRVLAPRPI